MTDGVLHHWDSSLVLHVAFNTDGAVCLCPQITFTAHQNLQRSRLPQLLLWMWVKPCCPEPGPVPRAKGRGTSQSATWSSAPAWSHLRRRKRRAQLSTAMGWPSHQVLWQRKTWISCFDEFYSTFSIYSELRLKLDSNTVFCVHEYILHHV